MFLVDSRQGLRIKKDGGGALETNCYAVQAFPDMTAMRALTEDDQSALGEQHRDHSRDKHAVEGAGSAD